MLLESFVIAEVYPGCDPLQVLAGQFSLEKCHTIHRASGSWEVTNRQRLEEWVDFFFFFKAAAVRIKSNLESLKKNEVKKHKVFTDFYSKFYFSLPLPLLSKFQCYF